MAFNDLFKVYPNRNLELRTVAKQAYEFGKTIAKESSAAHSYGLTQQAIERQQSYIDHITSMLDALGTSPIPDLPATHPTNFDINLSDPYITFTTNVGGEEVPLNEAAQYLAESWMVFAAELAMSQSAGLGGGLSEFDENRGKQNILSIQKMLDEIKARPMLDLPETSEPGSNYGVRSGGSTKTGASIR